MTLRARSPGPDVDADEHDATHFTYEQVFNGVPVHSDTIKVHVDDKGNLTGVDGKRRAGHQDRHRAEAQPPRRASGRSRT